MEDLDIMSFFPHPNPRDEQIRILREVEAKWDRLDVIAIIAPTAFGKTAIMSTIGRWWNAMSGRGATIVAPNRLLATQLAESTGFLTVSNKSNYRFAHDYYANKRALQGSLSVVEFNQYLANKAYNPLLMVDEAHNLVEWLRGHGEIKLWGHLDGFDDGQFSTVLDVERWLETTPPTKRTKALREKIGSHQYILESSVEPYRGNPQPCLRLVPLTPRENKPLLWPSYKVQKIVLLSATFSEEDLYSLGLEGRRHVILDARSPIPIENRPIKYRPIANMAAASQMSELPKVVDWIGQAMEVWPNCKGIIHSTYGLSYKLSSLLRHPRVLYHTKYNKAEVYEKWKNMPPESGAILVGCGMYEGLSLDGDLGRWQAILKVPYPSLGEPAIYAKMRERPDSYQWEAIRHIVQAAGRICRTPEDMGTTYIIDTNFARLYNNHRHLFPQFFKDAMEGL